MLRELISGQFSKDALIQLFLLIPIILFSLSVHESAHAFAAHKLGDDTARNLGRITLNRQTHRPRRFFVFAVFRLRLGKTRAGQHALYEKRAVGLCHHFAGGAVFQFDSCLFVGDLYAARVGRFDLYRRRGHDDLDFVYFLFARRAIERRLCGI